MISNKRPATASNAVAGFHYRKRHYAILVVESKQGEKEMAYIPINFQEKLAKFQEHWSPKVIAEMNDYQFKLVKVQGILFGISMRIRMRYLSSLRGN